MKFLLLALVVLGLLYMVLIDSTKTPVSDDEKPETLYRQEVERVEKLDDFLQDAVDRQGSEMDAVK